MKKQMPTLEQFAKIVRTNKRRLKKLYEDLVYARYLFYAAQGINYDKPPIKNSSPEFDKISIDLDRIDKIERKISYYELMDQLWIMWQKKMTSRETDVFHKRYMQDKKVVDIAADLTLSETRIYVLLKQLETKYSEFAKERSLFNH